MALVEKVTTMVLKVDLQCPSCYKRIKKVLCKFPEVRDQVYDEKENKVTITVHCCSPEKIRDKLCYKAGKVIKSIEMKEPPKPKEPEKPKVAVIEKPKEPEKPKVAVIEKPKEPEKPKVAVIEMPKEPQKPKSNGKADAPPAEKPKENPKPGPNPPPPEPVKMLEALPAQGLPQIYPGMSYRGPYYDGYGGGPYYHGYGVPPPPQPCYDGYYYGPGPHGYGRDHCNFRSYESYFTEENPAACSVM